MELRTRRLLTIGAFSRVSGLTVKALRHYDEIGLLLPWQVDPDTGYRHYALHQTRNAEAIRRLRSLDLPLDEVRGLVGADAGLLRERLAAHRAQIEGRAVETRRILVELGRLIEGKEPLVPEGEKFELELELDVKHVPERRVALIRERVHQDDMSSAVPRGIELVGGQIRAAGKRSVGPPFCRCPAADADGMLTTEIGWPVGEDVAVEAPVELTTYPAARALVFKHVGPYDELGRSYRLLSEVIERNGLTTVGDPMEWYESDPEEVTDPREYVTLIEWPIGPGGELDRSRYVFIERDVSRYAGQSRVTDPGRMSGLLADVPGDVTALQRAARGLVIHYRAEDLSSYGLPEERLSEVDSRYAEAMLERLFELDGRPLRESRPPEKRLLGCCRDFTVLLLTMARHRGIPARARVGFATYFEPGFKIDHEVAEVWDAEERRWRLVDAELGDDHLDQTDGVRVDPLDVPRDRFLVAGAAWEACRGGEADPEEFLVHPNLEIELTRGWPYLRHNLIHDLAALNKAELLLWDYWGLMEEERPSDGDLALLDRVARATLTGDASAEVQTLYADDARLRVPRTVTSYSPASAAPRTVVVET